MGISIAVVLHHGAGRGKGDGGAGLVACCDIAVAQAGTRFAFTETRIGLVPATISPYVIGRIGVTAAGGTPEQFGTTIKRDIETWRKVEGDKARRHFVMDHSYWGPHATAQQIDAAIAELTEFVEVVSAVHNTEQQG